MTDQGTDKDGRSLEEQLQELLRRANVSLFVNRDAAAPGTGKAPSPAPEPPVPEAEDRIKPIREFKFKPRDIRDYLDRFVIRQDEAKKVLGVALCDHYNHVRRCLEQPVVRDAEYAKHNILLLGPTGVGKTYMLRCAAKLIGVPFVKADATKFTETGYVGHDVEDLVRDLVKAADGDVELAQYGIVFMDEIDKIAAHTTGGGKDVSGRGVQINLLKLMEDTDVGLFSQTDLIGQMQAVMNMQRGREPSRQTVNTRHILFIVSGAFDKLSEQVRTRLHKSQIGFGGGAEAVLSEGDALRHATTRDFMDYGFEPEFIGRLPVRVVFDSLAAADLEAILKRSEGSVLEQYRADFEGYGIQCRVTDDAIHRIAELAHAEKTGARGLMTVLERLLREFKFELPSTMIKRFEVTAQTMSDVPAALAATLQQEDRALRETLLADIRDFAQSFQDHHGIRLTFAKDAMEAVVELCLAANRPAAAVCAERFRDFEYALKLIARNTGRNSFAVTRKLVEQPSEELARRVAESFQKGA